MTGPLDGRAAIVTGGATGIGLGIVARLLADGASVLVAALGEEELKRATEGLREAGHEPAGFVGNLAEPGRAAELLAAAVDAFGQVDILVNNAGGGVIRPTLEHTEQSLRATIDNNLWTTIRCTLALLPHMVERGYGRIVNIGAESVRNGLVDHAMYNAAKGGVHAMATGLAREFASAGITVNTVAPSYVQTPEITAALAENRFDQDFLRVLDRATELIPMGRPGTVDEVAGAVAYLVGPDAGFVTGQVISVNGGSSMG
ncbi:MAG TPA: SDR family oxidoreductase [Pseudonocardia sp.]|uniref:SDR family NAD(P)-dependent oxidoreductase n=1 Tax=Pseudonocardia sp. TaxID=60912 RepID=UPI002D086B48|nr:SDR family oxidoreductase [Pseudonocardia sp.]HTF52100.1 SDR family oxidoreductase [Pseudonocardia sp.]